MKRRIAVFCAALVITSVVLLAEQSAISARHQASVIPLNTPPVAEFTVEPSSGVVGTVFYFDPTASHDNEDSLAWLQVRFDWTADGIYDTGWQNPTNPFPRHIYHTVGTYTVRMMVKDRDDLSDTVEHDVTVADPGNNTPPTARCVVTPTEGTVDTVFTYSAATSSDQQDDASDLIARWDWYDTGKWITEWSPLSQMQTHQFDRHGLKTVRLEVRDTGTLSHETTCTVEVHPAEPNTPPTASFTVTPDKGNTTTIFTFDPGGSSDNEDSIAWLQVRFDWTDDGIYDTPWFNGTHMFNHIFSQWGQISVRMIVKDTGGLTDETTHMVEITPFQLYLPLMDKD